jgi:CheY-like chemotaxis protein
MIAMALILVFDDEPQMRQMVRRILTAAGRSVVEAEDGIAGLKLLGEHRPRIVITDILMPDKDGVETIRDIRRLSPGTTTSAISGGGAYGTALYPDSARKFGADAILPKPFRAAELMAAVDRLPAGR